MQKIVQSISILLLLWTLLFTIASVSVIGLFGILTALMGLHEFISIALVGISIYATFQLNKGLDL